MRTYTCALLFLVGCGSVGVGGEVDGQAVGGARDAIWTEFDLGPLEYTVVLISDYPDACAIIDRIVEDFAFDCDDRCDSYVDIAEEWDLDAESYWNLTFTLNTSDYLVGAFDQDDELGEAEFTAVFQRYDATPLQDGSCEDECRDGDLLASEDDEVDDGTLEILDQDDDALRGRFEVGLGGDDALEGRFVARPCDMDDWFF